MRDKLSLYWQDRTQREKILLQIEQLFSSFERGYDDYFKGSIVKEIEEELGKHSDKSSVNYKHCRFLKAWADCLMAPEDSREALIDAAGGHLQDAIATAARQNGSTSNIHQLLLKKCLRTIIQQKQPENAEQFFKNGLEKAQGREHLALRRMLLSQYDFFLKQAGRNNDADRIAGE